LEIFGEYGRIVAVDLPLNREREEENVSILFVSDRPASDQYYIISIVKTNRGTATIVYYLEDDADAAIYGMNGGCIDGSDRLHVSIAPRGAWPRNGARTRSGRRRSWDDEPRSGSKRARSPTRAALPPQDALFLARRGGGRQYDSLDRQTRSRSRALQGPSWERERDRQRSRSPGRTWQKDGGVLYGRQTRRGGPSPRFHDRRSNGQRSYRTSHER